MYVLTLILVLCPFGSDARFCAEGASQCKWVLALRGDGRMSPPSTAPPSMRAKQSATFPRLFLRPGRVAAGGCDVVVARREDSQLLPRCNLVVIKGDHHIMLTFTPPYDFGK